MAARASAVSDGDVGHEVLHRLEAPDRPAELLTLTHVREDHLDDPLHRADDLRAPGEGAAQVELLADLVRDDGAGLEVVEVELDRVAGLAGQVAPLLDGHALDGHVGDAPLVPVLPERHDAARVAGPRDVEGDPGRVGTAYGPQTAVVGQGRSLEEPATEQVVLGERHGRGGRGGEPEQGRGLDPAAAAAAGGLAAGQAGQPELLEPLPQAAVEVDDGGGRGAGGTVVVEEVGQHADEIGVGRRGGGEVVELVTVGHQRIPSPRAMTPRRISLVPPRRVKPGRWRIAACSSVSSSSSIAHPDAVRVST